MDEGIVIMQRIDNRMPNHGVQGQFNQPITINNPAIDYVYVLCGESDGTMIICTAFRNEQDAITDCASRNACAQEKHISIAYHVERHQLY